MSSEGVTLAAASRYWLKLGLVSFGGPAGQIALLHRELVQERRWLSERRYLHALNYCMLLPGPEAIQLATYLGWLMHGVRGGLIAGGLFLLPSVVVLLTLSSLYVLWGQQPLLLSVFWALKPAVLAIVIQASWRVGRRTLRHPLLAAIAAGAFLGLVVLRLPYPLIVVAAALTGWLGGRLRPAWFTPPPPHRPASANGAIVNGASASVAAEAPLAPIHDDDTPTPAHALFRPRNLAVTLLISGLALALPLAALSFWGGWGGELAQMARFFTRVALVSFGGAYAVLPYVAQGAVEHFGWLSAGEMADGLALGETTPGPLIMVVAFVGFMGGWNGSGSLLAALQAGLVTVWFTFLPSFVFILAGAPLVEASREDLRLGPPLTAITAAVTGVIASLALLLAGPSLAPDGRLDAGAIAVFAASLALLLGRNWGVLPLIGGAALVGLARLALAAFTGAAV
ncbi:MAG: chromate efflux transporter [Cyanobium sp.]